MEGLEGCDTTFEKVPGDKYITRYIHKYGAFSFCSREKLSIAFAQNYLLFFYDTYNSRLALNSTLSQQ